MGSKDVASLYIASVCSIAYVCILIAVFVMLSGCLRVGRLNPTSEDVKYDVVCSTSEREYRFESGGCYAYKGSFYFDQGLGQGMCFCVVKGAL